MSRAANVALAMSRRGLFAESLSTASFHRRLYNYINPAMPQVHTQDHTLDKQYDYQLETT